MLKIYKTEIVINVAFKHMGREMVKKYDTFSISTKYVIDENLADEEIILDKVSFQECCSYLYDNKLEYLLIKDSMFGRKLCVQDFFGNVNFKDFKYLTYKKVNVEVNDLSIAEIIKLFPADEAIQYFKERGMAVCPILSK